MISKAAWAITYIMFCVLEISLFRAHNLPGELAVGLLGLAASITGARHHIREIRAGRRAP